MFFLFYLVMKKSCNSCSSYTKLSIWATLPFLTILAILFIATSMNVFAETAITIPNEAAEPRCADDGSCFLPSQVTVGVGETLTWSNDSSVIHTVTSKNPEEETGDLFDSSIILAGDTFSYTFTEAGQYNYFCSVHPWMQGSVIVK